MGFIPTFSGSTIKYIGRPLEQITRANNVLSERYKANKASYENQIDFLDNLEVEDRNRVHVENASTKIKDAFGDVIASNDYEHSGNVVSEQARALKANRELKGSIQSQAAHVAYTQDLDERVKLGRIDSLYAKQLRAEANATNNQSITVDKDGNISHIFAANEIVNDPKLNDQINKLTAKLKASTVSIPGALLKREGNHWVSTTTHETINEVEATAAIAKMIKADPANQAWFAQEKRLADLDKYARAEDGTFARDAVGNLIEQPVRYRDKLKTIGIGANQLNAYVKQFNKYHDKESAINLETMTDGERNNLFKQIYDGEFINSKIDQVVRAGVAVVDYDKYNTKVYQDQKYMFDYKQRVKAAAIKKAAEEAPTFNLEIVNGKAKMARNRKTLLANNTLYKSQLDAGMHQMREMAGANDIIGDIIYDKTDGLVYVVNGNSKKLITDFNGGSGIQKYAGKALADAAFRYTQNQKTFDAAFSNLSKDDQNKYIKHVVTEITERGVFDLMNDIPTDELKAIAKEGYTTYHSPDDWNIGFNDDATFLKSPIEIFNRIRESSAGVAATNKYLATLLSDDNNVVSQRLDAQLEQMYNAAANNIETGRLVTDKVDYETSRVNGKFAQGRMYDTEGKDISEGASRFVNANQLKDVWNSKDMKIGITFKGGLPKTVYTGTFKTQDGEGKEITKPFTLVDNHVDEHLLHKITTSKEERTLNISHHMADFENNVGYFSKDIEVGQPYKMRVERLGIKDGKYTRDITQGMETVYVARELGSPQGQKPLVFIGHDKVEITGLVANYSEQVFNVRNNN